MNMLALQLLTAQAMTLGERVTYALHMLVVGLGAVFAILALLWGILVLARILLHDIPARKRDEQVASNKTPSPQATMPPACTPVPVAVAQPAQDNGVLIAVITAAVSAAMTEEGTLPPGGFRVVSFRRASDARAWNRK